MLKAISLIFFLLLISVICQATIPIDHSEVDCKTNDPGLVEFNCLVRILKNTNNIKSRCCWVRQQKKDEIIKTTSCEELEYDITIIENEVKALQDGGSSNVQKINKTKRHSEVNQQTSDIGINGSNNHNQASDLTRTPLDDSKHHSHHFNNEESFNNLLRDDKKQSVSIIQGHYPIRASKEGPLIKHIRNTAIIKQQKRKSSFNTINNFKKHNSLMHFPQKKTKKNSNYSVLYTQLTSTKDEYRYLKHLEKICDSSSEEESDLDESFNKHYIIHYNNFFKQCWDNFIIVFVILITIINPFVASFTSISSYIIITELSNCIVLLINIILNFLTSYIDNEDNLITNPIQIANNYLRNWFVFDIMSWFPYSLCVLNSSNDSIHVENYSRFNRNTNISEKICLIIPLIQMIKILIKGQLHSLLKLILDFFKINTQIERLVYFIVSFLLMNHVVACLWFLTAILQNFNPSCWILRLGYADDSAMRLYIVSFSWSLATVTTIGYGNISAGTTLERLYTLIVMSFGVVMFSFAIGSLSSIVNISDSKIEAMNQKLQILSIIKKEYSIDKETYERIRGSIKYDHHHNPKGDHNSFLQDLPSKLQIELSQSMHDSKIKQINFFKAYPNKDLFAFVAPFLKPIQFVQRDILYKSNDKIEEMYFISKGTVSFSFGQEYNDKEIKMIKRYNNFGEIEMCIGELLGYNIKIKSRTCDLFVLKKADFLKLSIRFQEIIEIFMQKSLMIFLRFKDKMMGMIQKSQLNDNKSESDVSRLDALSELNDDDEYVEQLECIDEDIDEESGSKSQSKSSNSNSSNQEEDKASAKDQDNTNNSQDSINESQSNTNEGTREKTEENNKEIESRTNVFNDLSENIITTYGTRNNNISIGRFNNKKKSTFGSFKEEVRRLQNKFDVKLTKLIDFIISNNIDIGNGVEQLQSPIILLKEIQKQDKKLKYRNELLMKIETILANALP